jgi:septum formation protein
MRPSPRRARQPCSSRICRGAVVAPLPLVLASGSPQRRALLERLDVPFTIRVSNASELEQGEDPAAVAVENALRKARTAHRGGTVEAVLGCDTIVVLDGLIYGKPDDASAARVTLAALGGRTHEVISGVALLLAQGHAGVTERTAVARTRVTFREIDQALLDWYVATEEWRGRSGGYAIQGAGAALALAVDGEEENVVGLPLGTLRTLCPELFDG